MKGTIVAAWISTCKRIYDKTNVETAMNFVQWDRENIFRPLEDI